MLRLVTYYTPTHAAMCRRFVLSRAWGFRERRAVSVPQTCPTGSFKSDGWNACMLDKLRVLQGLPEDGEPTVYVDADVALMRGFHDWCEGVFEELPGSAVAFADDVIQWCAGVMLFRTTPVVQAWWRLLADLSPIWNLPDQDVIHQLRQQASQTGGTLPIVPRVLPADRVCNWATVSAPTVPQPWDGEPFEVPESCVAFHANWTVGVERKFRMLESVVLNGGRDGDN
jgi:hypothetical protein